MEQLVEWLVGQVWSIGLVVFALGAGVYFTIATRFLQIRYFKEMIKLLFEGKSSETGISSFQAFCLALSGRVGIGNIAGVATAIAFGGPGAVFWMWVMALLEQLVHLLNQHYLKYIKVKLEMNIAVVHHISLKRLENEMVCNHCSSRCNTFIWRFITRYSI